MSFGQEWEEAGEARRPVRFRSIARSPENDSIHYLLDLGGVSGIFRYDLNRDAEIRLVHRNSFPADNLTFAGDGECAVALQKGDGTVGIAVSKTEGRHWNEISTGDAVSLSPAFIPDERSIVFQSAPIIRDAEGFMRGIGPFAVERLELKAKCESSRLVQADEFDHLSPRMTKSGDLYYIKRPYQISEPVTVWDRAKDVLLFPYRALMTFFAILNFFSMMFRQPMPVL